MRSAAQDRLFEHLSSTTSASPRTKLGQWHRTVYIESTALLSYSQVPKYCQDNPNILTGYRPVSSSALSCIKSWCYIHNESMNIYSHALPCIIFALIQTSMSQYLNTYYPLASTRSHLAFRCFLTCIVACFALSSIYHTMISHSHKVENLCLRADFVGIVLQIAGAFLASLRMGFWCEEGLQNVYGVMVSL